LLNSGSVSVSSGSGFGYGFLCPARVATATVERAFSAMKIIKTDLRNRIGDDFLYHCLITYVEIDVFLSISTDAIMHTYQGKHDRKGILP
jgi:hypothetical protein